MRMKEPSTSCSSPSARMAATALGSAMCTKPKLLGRRRPWQLVLACCLTVECATKTRTTWPYAEKCRFSVREALNPSLLMRRTMKRQSGFSLDSSCRLVDRVCWVDTGVRGLADLGATPCVAASWKQVCGSTASTGAAFCAKGGGAKAGGAEGGGVAGCVTAATRTGASPYCTGSCWNSRSSSCCCCRISARRRDAARTDSTEAPAPPACMAHSMIFSSALTCWVFLMAQSMMHTARWSPSWLRYGVTASTVFIHSPPRDCGCAMPSVSTHSLKPRGAAVGHCSFVLLSSTFAGSMSPKPGSSRPGGGLMTQLFTMAPGCSWLRRRGRG
mmetsp:Transcript_55949/g.173666  ORF Transcript_55949/g.173666 Transcript_55949/m.173666 type:complete len:329 (+) Transcript_55949:342-1328(+)